MNLQTFGVRPLFMVCAGLISLSAWAVEDNAALIKQGEYVARAADCGACHRTVEKDGPELVGGYAIESPMGKIIASNITPSKTHGIGNYTEQQLADALRKGINAQGQAGDAQLGRGQYLVDALAHCGACHTPRNALMAEDSSRYLSGATLDGWVALNITSDPASGVGRWSTDELALFLKNGHVTNQAQAVGGLALAGLLIAGLMGYVRRKRQRDIQRKKDALTRRFHSR